MMGVSVLGLLLFQMAPVTLVTHSNLWVGDLAMSFDGSRFGYVTREQKSEVLWIRNSSNLQGEKMALPPHFDTGLVFAPDGKSLYYNLPNTAQPWVTELHQWPLNGDSKKVADHVDTPIVFSPDGTSYAFIRNLSQGRFAVIVRGEKERQLADNVSRMAPAWSPDGGEIAYAIDRQLAFVSVRSGEVRKVSTPGRITAMTWPSRGNGLFAVIRSSSDGMKPWGRIWRFQPANSTWTPVTPETERCQLYRISASPDGSTIAAVTLRNIMFVQTVMEWIGGPSLAAYYSEVALIHAN